MYACVNLFFISPVYNRVQCRNSTFCPYDLPSVHSSVRPATIHVESSIYVCISAPVIAARVKHSIVIIRDILFMHAL